MKFYYQLLLTLSILIFSFQGTVKATHIMGGDITYECVGQDSFLVSLSLYRDCAGVIIGATQSISISSSCATSTETLFLQSTTEVSQLCPSQMVNSTCNGGTQLGVEKLVFTKIITLDPLCSSWRFSWESCCRPNNVSNLVNSGSQATHIFNTMNSVPGACDNSPKYESKSMPIAYLNKQFNYNFGATDVDGDSLEYLLARGYLTQSTFVTYVPGVSFTQPIPYSTVTLDSTTGEFTCTPTVIGVSVVNVIVNSYDKVTGLLRGSILRDMLITVVNSSNTAPEVNSLGYQNVSGATLTNANTIELCAGGMVSFDITIEDVDTLDNISISHNLYDIFETSATITEAGTNPTIIHVNGKLKFTDPGNYSFIISGSDATCSIPGVFTESFTIIQNSTVKTIDDITICAGAQWVNLLTLGDGSLFWATLYGAPIVTDTNSSLYNFSCVVCSSPDVSPQVTSTFVVTGNNVNSCPSADTVIVTVAPDFTLSVVGDTILCSADSIQLNATVFPIGNNYTYKWSPSTNLNFDSVNNPKAYSVKDEYYKVIARSSQGCEKEGVVTASIFRDFPSSLTITSGDDICAGDTANLVLKMESPNFSCGVSNLTCIGTDKAGIIGTDLSLTSFTGYPNPYGIRKKSGKHQMLYTAAEMRGMGFQKGKINAIYFDIETLGASRFMQNFEIKMGCTSLGNLSMGWQSGLVTVKNAYSHRMKIGWNKHNLDVSYDWDGETNLVIEICFFNSVSVNFNPLVNYSTTNNVSVIWASDTGMSICNQMISPILGYNRPNIKFDYCSGVDPDGFNYVWTPSSSVDASLPLSPKVWPSVTTNYQLVVSDTNGVCSRTINHTVNTTTKYDAGFTTNAPYCLNDPTTVFVTNRSGGTFSGAGILANGNFNPSDAGLGTWPINYNFSHPICANDSTILVQVIGLPDASFVAVEVCFSDTNPVTLVPTVPGGTWSGLGIIDKVNGVFSASGLAVGDYPVVYTVTTSCTKSDTINVRIIPPYDFTFNNTTVKVCENTTIDLRTKYQMSSNPSQGYKPIETWSSTNGNVNANGVFDAVGLPLGSYQVDLTISGADGTCGTTKSVTVQVVEVKYVTKLQDLKYCTSKNNVKIYVNPWLYGTGVEFTQTALPPLATNDTLIITAFGQNGQFNPKDKGAGSWEITFFRTTLDGCVGITTDTIYVLDTPTGNVTNDGTTLTSNDAVGSTFQWLDCDFGNSPLTGATNQSYTPGRVGNFAVEVTAGSCSITSGCYRTWPASVQNVSVDLGVSVYPNPAKNELNIDLGNNDYLDIEITDNVGKVVVSQTTKSKVTIIDLSHLLSGVYVVKTKNALGEQVQKIVKQ